MNVSVNTSSKDEMNKKKFKWNIPATVFAVLFIACTAYVINRYPNLAQKIIVYVGHDKIISENILIPNTRVIGVYDARVPHPGVHEVPLVENNGEHIVVPNAVLTLKGSYDFVTSEAHLWSKDAKLIFIRSLGAVTLEGKSSTWQLAFGSALKKRGYEIIVQGDTIISQKEVESDANGFNLPDNWYDSPDALVSLASLPQFKNATVSGINFYYNTDGKRWGYVMATSHGGTSMPVK